MAVEDEEARVSSQIPSEVVAAAERLRVVYSHPWGNLAIANRALSVAEGLRDSGTLPVDFSRQLNAFAFAQRRSFDSALFSSLNLDESAESALKVAQAGMRMAATLNLVSDALRISVLPRVEAISEMAKAISNQYPRNLRETSVRAGLALKLGREEGLCLAWVPSGQPLRRLGKASTKDERMRILGTYKRKILNDCRESLASDHIDRSDPHVIMLLESIAAISRDFSSAGQALASNVIDSRVRQRHDQSEPRAGLYKQFDRRSDSKLNPDTSLSGLIVLGALAGVFATWRPDSGEPPPSNFNRHATTHNVWADQYRLEHAIQAVMLATSLIVTDSSGLL